MNSETQLELPFSLEDCGGMRAVYRDQEPYRAHFNLEGHERHFFSCLTVYGIQCLDQEFCDEIINFKGGKKAYLDLRRRIIHNEHLHQCIKNNLLFNLEERHGKKYKKK